MPAVFFQDVRLFLQADFFCCDGGCGVCGRKFDGLTGDVGKAVDNLLMVVHNLWIKCLETCV